MFQGVAQVIASTANGYLLIPGGPGASDVYRWLNCLSQYTIDCEFSPIWGRFCHVFGGNIFLLFIFSQIDIMQLFSADAATFSKKLKKKLHLKTWKNHPQKMLIIDPNFFLSIANQPKISPNHIFCSIKMSPCANSM